MLRAFPLQCLMGTKVPEFNLELTYVLSITKGQNHQEQGEKSDMGRNARSPSRTDDIYLQSFTSKKQA